MRTDYSKVENLPPGPWTAEGSYKSWVTSGLRGLIRRSPGSGALCGYVAVPAGHKLYGVSYWDVIDTVAVHGGLTFSDHWSAGGDAWWFGFDCAHYGDLAPAPQMFCVHGEYRTMEYVCGQVERLADQLVGSSL